MHKSSPSVNKWIKSPVNPFQYHPLSILDHFLRFFRPNLEYSQLILGNWLVLFRDIYIIHDTVSIFPSHNCALNVRIIIIIMDLFFLTTEWDRSGWMKKKKKTFKIISRNKRILFSHASINRSITFNIWFSIYFKNIYMHSVYSNRWSVRLSFIRLSGAKFRAGISLELSTCFVWHKMQLFFFVCVFLEWHFLSFPDWLWLSGLFCIAVSMNEYIYINKSTTQLKYSYVYRSSSDWRSWKLVREFLWFSLSFCQLFFTPTLCILGRNVGVIVWLLYLFGFWFLLLWRLNACLISGCANFYAIHSCNLCHSAICLRGELHTSFQWFWAAPAHRGPPNSSRPITWNHRKLFEKCPIEREFKWKIESKAGFRIQFNSVTILISNIWLEEHNKREKKKQFKIIFTSFLVTRSQSSSISSIEIFSKLAPLP